MIPGNSGAEVIFTGDTVIKTGGERLAQQMEFQLGHDHPDVWTPRVFDSQWRGNVFGFEMEYIRDATTIFKADTDVCLDKLIQFVLANMRQSCYDSLQAKVFVDKINSIDVGEWGLYAEDLKQRFSAAGRIRMLVGPMHGDLSLTNVLCRGGDVWLIDFLDGFISTPLLDIAKMRQDSYHGWIELFEDAPHRDYVDARIMQEFGRWPWLQELQLLNLLRIVPYARDQRVIDFLRREIPRAYNNLDGGRR